MSSLFRDFSGSTVCPRGSVVCIGAFDGLHLGHQSVLRAAKQCALQSDLPLVVVSFEALPREYFSPSNPPARLILAAQKIRLLKHMQVDVIGLLRFNKRLANTTPAEFIEQLLVNRLNAKHIFIGPDFMFGKNREGNAQTLQRAGLVHHFNVHVAQAFMQDHTRVSSSLIRTDLQQGELQQAAEKLGRNYALQGRVVRGKQLGRTLGFPTANIRFQGKKPALLGVYATWVHGVSKTPIASVSSVGTRPTVNGKEPLLEAHLFDFDDDLYGKTLCVEFVQKLRDEQKYDNLDSMVRQIHRDAQQARAILARSNLGECA